MSTAKQRTARANLISRGVLMFFGAVVASHFERIHGQGIHNNVIAILGVLIFVVFAVLFLHILTVQVKNFLAVRRFGVSRAASIQYGLRIVGYVAIALVALSLLNIPVGKLLFGGAVVGIILGVAAQQALGNFFASIILITSHPFSVGEHVIITSGGLGGKYEGTVKDIGLTHTKLREEDGTIALLPNATILSAASVRRLKPGPAPENEHTHA